MHLQDRWRIILDEIKSDKVTSVEALIEKTGGSPATIRRDLTELQKLGRLRRVRGGATRLENGFYNSSETNTNFLQGQSEFVDSLITNSEQKNAIAAKAISFIKPGQSIIIDGGTTAYLMASLIPNEPLQVLTNSIPILQCLLNQSKIKITLPGGELFREQKILLNTFEDKVTDNFFASHYFIGCQAITKNGLMQTDGLLVQSERRLLERAEQIVVLADSSKFHSQGSLSVCSLSEIDVIITDTGIDSETVKMLEDAGINLIIVPFAAKK